MKSLKSCIGPPAEGADQYLPRPHITGKIQRKLAEGANLLISAPRRIGKSSILKYLLNQPGDNQVYKYLIVQSVSSPGEFFKQLFNELIKDKHIFSRWNRYINAGPVVFKKRVRLIKSVKSPQ